MPKANNQTRLIFHLSYDFGTEDKDRSLNFHTPSDLCRAKYLDLDHAVKASLEIQNRWEKSIRGTELAEQGAENLVLHYGKSDLRSAFRLLPVLPSQRQFLFLKPDTR